MKKICSREFFNQAILILLVILTPSFGDAGFLGGNSANVGTDWTNTDKTLTTTGNVNSHDVTATGKVTTTEGVVYNQGDTNAVNTTIEAKLAVQVIADTDYTSLALAISNAGSIPTKLNICQENTIADGTTITPPTTMVLDFDCGGSIKGVAGGGTETFIVGHIVNNLNKKIFGADLSVDFATFRPAEISAKWFGDTYVQATITAALTAIGTSDVVTLKIDPSTWVISSNADWSAYTNVTFKIVSGAMLQIATATTTTFGKQPDIGLYQAFNCVGTGTVAGLKIAYPEWFGAVGDNSTDDAIALNKVFANTAEAVFLSKMYRTTAKVTVGTGVKNISGYGPEISGIDATGATISEAVLLWEGTGFTSIANLASDAVGGSNSVTFASDMSAVLFPGDVFVIFNPTNSSYSAARTYYYAGEYCEVLEVNGAVVTLMNPLAASYTFTAVGITKMSGVSGKMENISVVGTGLYTEAHASCKIRYGKNININNCRFEKALYSGLYIDQSYKVTCERIQARCVFPITWIIGTQYGVVVGNSQGIKIVNSNCESIRHAIAVGGSSSAGVTDPRSVNRDIQVSENTLRTQNGNFALDAHGNTEKYIYSNNVLYGGIDFGGNDGQILDNKIITYNSAGLLTTELHGANFILSGNDIKVHSSGSTTTMGIYIYFDDDYFVDVGSVTFFVNDNKIYHNQMAGYTGNVTGIGVVKTNNVGTAVSVKISNNICTTDIVGKYGIWAHGEIGEGASNLNVEINNNTIKKGRIYADYVADCLVENNNVDEGGGVASYHGITVIQRIGSPKAVVRNNTVWNTGQDGIRVTAIAPAADNFIVITNNTVANDCTAAAGYGFFISSVATSLVEFHGNTVIKAGALEIQPYYLYDGIGLNIDVPGAATLASATALLLAQHPESFINVTGTTNITSIGSGLLHPPGFILTLKFADILTFTDGSNLKLAGNFVTTADDTITLQFDGTNWVEISRSIN